MRWVWLTIIAGAVAAAQVAPQGGAAPRPAVQTAPQLPEKAAPAEKVTPEALAAAQKTAESAAKDWSTQARALDAQLAPLLPCDPKARKTVQDVSGASDARVTALANYLRLEAALAAEQTSGARRMLEAEEARNPEAGDERTDAALERSTAEAQSSNLSSSANIRPGLTDARNTLGQITDIVGRRSALVEQSSTARDKGVAALRDLVTAYQGREGALKEEISAFQAEAARWNTYYSVRLTRVQAECSAIGGGAAAPAPAPARNTKRGTAKGSTKKAAGSPQQ